MASIPQAIRQFLAAKRIAVAGVSRDPRMPANHIYVKLRGTHSRIFPVNPHAQEVEGDPCFPNLAAIPGGVEALVISTPPAAAEGLVRECMALGIHQVWMHRAFGEGSVSPAAVRLARENGITVIDGACPMMYVEPIDFAHKCVRGVLGMMGKLPAAARA